MPLQLHCLGAIIISVKGTARFTQDQEVKFYQAPPCIFANSYFNLCLPDVGQQQLRCGNKVVNEERHG